MFAFVKFIFSEMATQFCQIFTLLLSYVVPVKSKVKILQTFVAFSEYMNFIRTMQMETLISVHIAINIGHTFLNRKCHGDIGR